MIFLPNLLSIIRIVFIPFFLKYFLMNNYLLAGIIFSFSAFTDFLDGYLARKYNWKTELGRILDPLADKLTIISILLALILTEIIPRYIAFIILFRELFILISSSISLILGIDFINPSLMGKISIFLLYLAIAFRLLGVSYLDMILFYIVIPLNVFSAVDYIVQAYQKLHN